MPTESPRDDAGSSWLTARIAVNRVLFRALVFGGGGATVATHQAGLPRWVSWETAKLTCRTICNACGVELEFRGLERLEQGGPFIITPNHQSHVDICALLGFLPGHNVFASKKELFDEPILGMAMRALSMLPIDREDLAKSIEVLRRARDRGRSIVIFPEGTRSRDGSLLPFKKGAFVAAIEMGAPVVPISVKGSHAIMPKGSYLSIVPGRVEIVVHEPIPTTGLGYENRTELADRVRGVIAEELARGGTP